MDKWSKVRELPPTEKGFQVFHRRLQIPWEVYQEAMSEFPQPDKEEGYQDFVARYLAAQGDPGIVGMVRVEEWKDVLELDAAVRYPVEPDINDELAHFWSS